MKSSDDGLRRLALAMNVLCIVGMVGAVALAVVSALRIDEHLAEALAPLGRGAVPADLHFSTHTTLMALAAIGPAILATALFHLRTACTEAAQGRYFSAVATRGFRNFAGEVLAWSVFMPAAGALTVFLMAVDLDLAGRRLPISVSTESLAGIFIALMVLLMALIFDRARALAEENAAFL